MQMRNPGFGKHAIDHVLKLGIALHGRDLRLVPYLHGSPVNMAELRRYRLIVYRLPNGIKSLLSNLRVGLFWELRESVDRNGQNSIVVASGANFAFPAADVEGSRASFRGARFALFQLETPLDTVGAALKLAQQEGTRPSPASFSAIHDVITFAVRIRREIDNLYSR